MTLDWLDVVLLLVNAFCLGGYCYSRGRTDEARQCRKVVDELCAVHALRLVTLKMRWAESTEVRA